MERLNLDELWSDISVMEEGKDDIHRVKVLHLDEFRKAVDDIVGDVSAVTYSDYLWIAKYAIGQSSGMGSIYWHVTSDDTFEFYDVISACIENGYTHAVVEIVDYEELFDPCW